MEERGGGEEREVYDVSASLFFLLSLSRPTSDNWTNIYTFEEEESTERWRKVSLVRLWGWILRDFFFSFSSLVVRLEENIGREEGGRIVDRSFVVPFDYITLFLLIRERDISSISLLDSRGTFMPRSGTGRRIKKIIYVLFFIGNTDLFKI